MADSIENYTCADESLITTEAKRSERWQGRKVDVFIDRPASRIHTIENFMNAEECAAVEARAKPILHDATVADGSGGSKLSESRKAKQAGIKVYWDKEKEGDLVARVSRRVYDYVNYVLPFGIKENGQEDLRCVMFWPRNRRAGRVWSARSGGFLIQKTAAHGPKNRRAGHVWSAMVLLHKTFRAGRVWSPRMACLVTGMFG